MESKIIMFIGFNCSYCGGSWRGGGVLLIMAFRGKLRPKGVPFFRLQVYERVGILLVEVYERAEKSVISV